MKRIVIFMMFALLLLPATAWADNISYQGMQQPGLKVEGYVGWGWHSQKVSATTGEFKVTWDEQEVLAAYCTDILTSGVGGAYSVAALNTFDYDQYESLYQAAWIMDNYAPGLGYIDSQYSSTVAATAVQAAIWHLLTPGYNSWNLTKVKTGSWSDKQNTMDLYASVLGEASQVDFSSYDFKNDFYFGDSQQNRQDLLFATGGAASAPEPGTMLLMGSALTGLWGYTRRRRRRKKV
ncbi:MAG: PEP-CTERM sorting domain-containing protein [Desulfarculaceae bacterium]|nr:PEP-CTERM sorting domain-containing protein [Desulfarculaceae bacterium]